jgi:hypothetical protein
MRIKTALVLGLLLAFTAACGDDGGGDGVASAGDATEESAETEESAGEEDFAEQAIAYSQCMRDNGVENFPDPEIGDGGGVSLSLSDEVDFESEEFQAAEEACNDLLPGGDEGGELDPVDIEHMREYSQCMRDNGFENFPDPSADGGIMIDSETLGVDPTGPEMQAAEEACEEYLQFGPAGGSTNSQEDE